MVIEHMAIQTIYLLKAFQLVMTMTKGNFLCKDIQKTKTTFFKHPKYAIFFKSRGFKDIKNVHQQFSTDFIS